MANKKINELSTRTPSLTDLLLVGDPTSGYSYKCTVTSLATIIETDIADAYVTLDTAQTISGAKTFSNNLTLTSVTNAATTQTKFLTLNGSNVVNYRTGAQVLTDIGGADDTLVVHKAGDETITGIKTFSVRGKFDAGINLKQGSGASLDTGYSAISADATTFYFHRATSIAALSVNNLTTTRTYTLQDANGTLAFLSDIPSLSGYVPTSRTLTINGTSYDLSANRSWNVGTVTSVVLTTGTTGTDISVSGSPITSSGTITLNIPTASATNRGALSSIDWTTFNNKQNTLTLTTTGTSGAATLVGATLNIPQYQGVLTNPVTGTGTTNYIPKFTGSTSIGNSQIFDNGTNVGIGTASPTGGYLLDIRGRTRFAPSSTNYIADFISSESNGSSLIVYADNSNVSLVQGGTSAVPLTFYLGGSERMRLTSAGSLGLGTSTPSYKFQVEGGAGYFNLNGSGTTVPLYVNNSSTAAGTQVAKIAFASSGSIKSSIAAAVYGNDYMTFNVGSDTERMRLDASGNLGLGTSTTSSISGGYTGFFMNGSSGSNIDFRAGGTGYGRVQADVNGLLFAGLNSVPITFFTSGSERMRLDASGNLGLGVTPSAWASGYKAFEFGNSSAAVSALFSNGPNDFWSVSNAYFDGTSFKYITTGTATGYEQVNGSHKWYQVASGSGGASISFTQAMTLDASGNLGIGTTSPNNRLQITAAAGSSHVRWTESATTVGFVGGANGIIAGQNGSFAVRGENGLVLSGAGNAANLYINSSGNVGIGTTSPGRKLSIDGGASTATWTGYQQNGTEKLVVGLDASGNPSFYGTQANDAIFYTNNSERMRITIGGNVGIGTTAELARTTILSDANAQTIGLIGRSLDNISTIRWWNNAGNTIYTAIESNANYTIYNTVTNGYAAFLTNNAERMRITSVGNVGIGTTSPLNRLHIDGSTGIRVSASSGADYRGIVFGATPADGAEYSYIKWQPNSGEFRLYANTAGFGGFMSFYSNNSEAMRITSAGELLINTTSDAGDYKLQVNGNSYVNGDMVFGGSQSLKWGSNTYIYGSNNTQIEARVNSNLGWTINSSGNTEFGGSIKTAAPSGGTAKPWKLGQAGVTLGGSNTSGIAVEIDGTTYYLVTGYLP